MHRTRTPCRVKTAADGHRETAASGRATSGEAPGENDRKQANEYG